MIFVWVAASLFLAAWLAHSLYYHFWIKREHREQIARRFGQPLYTDQIEVLKAIARQMPGKEGME